MAKLMLGTREITPVISSTKVESLNITPTTSPQVITPTGDIDAFNPINVSAVTSAIDSNIQAGNIKKGITILGVTGNVGSDGVIINREVSAQGVYQMPTSSFTFSLPSTATDIDYRGMYYAFRSCLGLTLVDLSSLTTISGTSGMSNAFQGCVNLTTVDLSSLTTISNTDSMNYAFQDCTSLTSVDLSSLTTISGTRSMCGAFYGCTSLASLDLSSLTTINDTMGMAYTFRGCTSLISIDLSSLAVLNGSRVLYQAFQNCTSLTSLSFPALNSNSFYSLTDQFNNMLQGVTGCTVHFPSNLQSVIGYWSDVTAGFGGTNTTVLYDLPATS